MSVTHRTGGAGRVSPEVVTARLAEAEAIVRYYASRCRVVGMDRDDVRQELRIRAWRLVDHYDDSRGASWRTYLYRMLGYDAIDMMRRHGDFNKRGYIRTSEMRFSDVRDDRNPAADPIFDPCSDADELAAIDWQDLRERCEAESQEVQALFMECCGFDRAEIGDRFGVGKTRVFNLLSSSFPRARMARQRLRYLALGE
jgi:DNA-directed RNA polymerase specialized sigma24 family protein